MLLAHLWHKKRVSRLMSSYQMLRVVWTYLSTSDWTKEGVSMAVEDEVDKVRYVRMQFWDYGGDGTLEEMLVLHQQ